jgi:hypothetical protein
MIGLEYDYVELHRAPRPDRRQLVNMRQTAESQAGVRLFNLSSQQRFQKVMQLCVHLGAIIHCLANLVFDDFTKAATEAVNGDLGQLSTVDS